MEIYRNDKNEATDTEALGKNDPAIINNRYKIVKHLGEGGMGSVYLVEDILFESTAMALKQIHESRVNPQNLRAFHNEFRAMTRLKHPNLVQVFDFGFDRSANSYYLTLEYIDGYPLRELRNKVSRVSSEQVISLFVDLCRAIAFMHSRNIVHRDINPGNIMCSYAGQVKLMDFGLVDIGMEVQQSKGTIAYMAPEVINGNPDHRTDIFSLGLTFYEALTATPFYDQSNAQHIINLLRDKDAFSQHRSRCISAYPAAESLRPLFERMLAFESEERFQNCTEIIAAVNTVRGTTFSFESKKTKEAYVRGTEFVGRERELNLLKGSLAAAHATAVWVQGEAGIGKSRLFHEFKNWCQLNTIIFFEGTCYENINRQFGPFLPVVSELLLHASEEVISEYGPQLKKILPHHHLLSTSTIAAFYDPKTEHRILVRTLTQYIADCIKALRSPCVIYLNDLQWADEGSIEMIKNIVDSSRAEPAAPVHLYLCSRLEVNESLTSILQTHAIECIRLHSFQTDMVQTYITATFGEQNIGPQLQQSVSIIHKSVGGNPFFLQELIKSLITGNQLVRNDQCWDLIKPLTQTDIPANLEELITVRLKKLKLHEHEFTLLHIITLINRPVSWQELDHICSPPSGLLKRLEYAEILNTKQINGILYFDITHDLIRNAISTMITDRVRIHTLIAAALEQIHANELESFYEELGYHYYRAQHHDKALLYLRNTITAAMTTYDTEKAIVNCDRALELFTDEELDQKVDLLNQKCANLFIVGKMHHVFSVLNNSFTLAKQIQYSAGKALALYRMGYCTLEFTESPHDAIDYFQKALHEYNNAMNKEGIADTYMILGYCAYYLEKDYDTAMEYVNSGMVHAEEIKSNKCIAHLTAIAAQVNEARGDFKKALACITQTLKLIENEEIKDKYFTLRRDYSLYSGLCGFYHRCMKEYTKAIHWYDIEITIAEKLGNPGLIAFGLFRKAEVMFEQKRFHEAKTFCDQARSYFNEVSDYEILFVGKVVCARVEFATGNKKEATALLEELLDSAQNRFNRAKLYYELWRMTHNETLREHALKHYRQITVNIKNWLYLQRLQELEMNRPSDHVFVPKSVKKRLPNRLSRLSGYGYR